MKLIVNGVERDLSAENLCGVLAALELSDAKVATAVNGEFVSVRARQQTSVRDGDRIEIVAPRQGG